MNKPTRVLCALIAISCCAASLALASAYGADRGDKKEIVKQARQEYYSLRNRGLIAFTSSVQPNWRLVLKDQLAANPEQAENALTMLNGIHFLLALGPDGGVNVTHRADIAPSNEKVAEGFNQIFGGMEQTLSGFFDSWSPFMLTSPFPDAAGDYRLEELDNQYRLSYKEGSAAIATSMSKKDLVISEIAVESPEFKSVIKPQFTKSEQGLLLSGYQANYQGAGGGATVQLNVQIENQPVSGLQLPRKLNLSGSYQGSPFEMELVFSDYQLKKQVITTELAARP
jgi:hypothetical protein